jgi:UPF0716 protein FxsA
VLGRLFLLFTIVPVLELYLLISIGRVLGAPATVAIVLITGIAGAALARREGTRVLRSWQAATQRGELPKDGVISSLLVLVGGVLLVAPGVLTDVTGLMLLMPPVRRRVAPMLKRWLERRFRIEAAGPAMMFGVPFGPGSAHDVHRPTGDVIDTTVVEADEVEADDAPPSRRGTATPSLRP